MRSPNEYNLALSQPELSQPELSAIPTPAQTEARSEARIEAQSEVNPGQVSASRNVANGGFRNLSECSDHRPVSGVGPVDQDYEDLAGELSWKGSFELERGGLLRDLKVPYRIVGPTRAPVVVVLGGISGNRMVCDDPQSERPGWWNKMAGPGAKRAIDTTKVRVLSFDYLGRYPEQLFEDERLLSITTRDQARILHAVLDELGLDSIQALIGASYGAMVGLRFAADFGPRLQHLVAISGAHRAHPMATAWRSIQRNIVRMGLAQGATAQGLALARALAMTTYRSADEFAERFDGPPTEVDGQIKFPVEHYLEQRGNDFLRYFTPESFIALSESIDLHRVDPQSITCPTTVIGVQSDVLVPIGDSADLAAGLSGRATLHKIDSLFGHDAFLKEIEALSTILGQHPLFAATN